MKKALLLSVLLGSLCVSMNAQRTFTFGTAVSPSGDTMLVDSVGIAVNGKHSIPVMGEIHFSRVPERDWDREIRKMKAGGVDIIACYVFWNHHEAEEGRFDWSGNRNLRKFLGLCHAAGEHVVLRVGPFCHGEVYLGGIPEWVVDNALADPGNYALRSTAPGFIESVARLYDEIGRQAEGLLWKDGGPVIGVQVDNESAGPWPYLATLKEKIVAAGLDVPFYTRTGWPRMQGPAAFGEILPLYGDYADGFWDRELTDMPGEYRAAFRFRSSRLSSVIATETFGTDQSTVMDRGDLSYPYLTCELGGGMMPSYHRRIHIFDKDALGLVICKLGSGSNLPGYYMYHGGSNPYCAEHSMAELQDSKSTNWNDMPHITYDFQAPLGEMGQPNMSYHYLRLVHQMLREWGELMAPMSVTFYDDGGLRRTRRGDGTRGFVFVNNYERMAELGDREWNFFGQDIIVPDGASFCFPYGLEIGGHTLDYATAQPFCVAGGKLYMAAVEGIDAVVSVDGKAKRLRLDRTCRVNGLKIYVMSPGKALTAYKTGDRVRFSRDLLYEGADGRTVVEKWRRENRLRPENVAQAGEPRKVGIGAQYVAEQPSELDFDRAAVWSFRLPRKVLAAPCDYFVEISYRGDVARVYADGRLVEDNFWNGRTMLVRCSDLIKEADGSAPEDGGNFSGRAGTVKSRAQREIELRVLPLSADAPIYLQKEQREELSGAGPAMLSLDGIRLVHRITK